MQNYQIALPELPNSITKVILTAKSIGRLKNQKVAFKQGFLSYNKYQVMFIIC